MGGDDPAATGVRGGLDGRVRLVEIDVGDGDVVVRLPLRGDRHERRTHATCTDHEYSHGGNVLLGNPVQR